MKLKNVAKQRIQEVEQKIQNLPENVQVFTYVTLYHTLEELYFQKKYNLVTDLCNALLKDGNLIQIPPSRDGILDKQDRLKY